MSSFFSRKLSIFRDYQLYPNHRHHRHYHHNFIIIIIIIIIVISMVIYLSIAMSKGYKEIADDS